MMSRSVDDVQAEAQRMAEMLEGVADLSASVQRDVSYVGSGSIPDEGIETRVVRMAHESIAPEDLARRLRMGLPSVFARVSAGAVLVDVRTLFAGEAEEVAQAVRQALAPFPRGRGSG